MFYREDFILYLGCQYPPEPIIGCGTPFCRNATKDLELKDIVWKILLGGYLSAKLLSGGLLEVVKLIVFTKNFNRRNHNIFLVFLHGSMIHLFFYSRVNVIMPLGIQD